jgi:hypothetical protein
MSKTIEQLAQIAIDVQNACNLSGVVIAWSDAVTELRRLHPELGTLGINGHPVNQMFAAKVIEMTGMGVANSESYQEAYQKCLELAGPHILPGPHAIG